MEDWRRLLAILFDPLALLGLALLVLSGLVWWQRAAASARWLTTAITVALLTTANPFLANQLQDWLETQGRTLSTCKEPPVGSVIVVLAGGIKKETNRADDIVQMEEQTFRRTVAGAHLALRVPDSTLVLSGGSGGRVVEADLMQVLAMDLGVPADRIVEERHSRSTFDNAVATTPIVAAMPGRPIYLVTSAMHMRRAAASFRATGQSICPYAVDFQRQQPEDLDAIVPRLSALQKTTQCLVELGAYALYEARGWAVPPAPSHTVSTLSSEGIRL